MTTPQTEEIARDLRVQQELCRKVLTLVDRERVALRDCTTVSSVDFLQQKRAALQQLNEILAKIQAHRVRWQSLPAAARAEAGEVPELLRQNQDLIMRIIVLDRENEQALLRQGLVPPRHLPPTNRQRPHFVTDLYRRQSKPDPAVAG